MGRPVARAARRPFARGCAPLPEAAHVRPRRAGPISDGVRCLLPPVCATGRRPRGRLGRAARGRRQSDRLAACRRCRTDGPRRELRARAVRIVPRAPRNSGARGGYLPILETRYVDSTGARYTQESFAARVAWTQSLVSFVQISVDTRRAKTAVRLRLSSSGPGSRATVVPRGTTRTVYAAWVDDVHARPLRTVTARSYADARGSVVSYWTERLADGASISVPGRRSRTPPGRCSAGLDSRGATASAIRTRSSRFRRASTSPRPSPSTGLNLSHARSCEPP